MNMAGIDPKQQAILEAAWMAFSTYGFRKTSMDDIAKGAGMSRPALYLHFKNKDAIFRALVTAYYGNAAAELGAGEANLIPQNPEEGNIIRQVHLMGFSIDAQVCWHGGAPLLCF